MDKILTIFDYLPTYLDVDIFYPKRGQKEAFFDHLPTSSCPRSFWTTPIPVLFVRLKQGWVILVYGYEYLFMPDKHIFSCYTDAILYSNEIFLVYFH